MFDIVLASSPGTSFAARMATALRAARMRVVSCEVAPQKPPPAALRVDAAVACGPTGTAMLDVARSVRGAFDGPPPVIGVSGGAPVSAPGELAHTFPDDVAVPALVAQVQRAAARAERQRSRVVLRGELDDVGLDALLASLAARARTCFVRVREGARRAEITLHAGRTRHVRADGIDASRDPRAALSAIGAWAGASFEVIAHDDAPPPRSGLDTERPPAESARPPAASVRPPAASTRSGDAGDVALGAAVLNACAAYGRAFLGADRATALLADTWARCRFEAPSLDAFAVSREGMVTVVHVERARGAIPDAIAFWMAAFFEQAAAIDSERFRRVQLREVLGGLTRLVEQVGWASALLEGERRTPEGSTHV